MISAINNKFKKNPTLPEKDPSKLIESPKIAQMFNNAKVSAFCAQKENGNTANRRVKEAISLCGGGELALFAKSTGATTGLHEVVGHGLLGYGLTSHSSDPQYGVDGWDNFHKMTRAHSFQGGLMGFFQWLFLGTGAGWTSHSSSSQPNGLGQAMGPSGQDAWISVAGSLPGLALDTLSVTGGMHLKKRSPILGNALVGFGLADNMMNAAYPISAAAMSTSQMRTAASNGHDFANFALQMSTVTGIPAQDIAISTAVFWTGFVPVVAGASYLHTKSQIKDVVPDALALKHWIQTTGNDPKVAELLKKYYEAYPQKKLLEKIKIEELHTSPVFVDFINYLLETMPEKTLDISKKEILSNWEKKLPKDRVQTALTTASVIGLITAVTSKILSFLALATPSLQSAATMLGYVSIVFIGASVLSSAYQLYKDFRCPDFIVPIAAKMLSVAHLVSTIACASLIIAAFFVPGLNLIFFAVLIVGCIVNIILSHRRAQVIRRQFALTQALSAEVWNVMYPLWKNHQWSGKPMGRVLKKWSDLVSKKVDLQAFQRSQQEIVCTDTS